MRFEWDELKRQRILADRGLDFIDARLFFDGRPTVVVASPRGEEERYCSTALIEGRFISLIWMLRGDAIRIVTMRRAHAREERQYRQLHP